MRVTIQRVSEASVKVDGAIQGQIGKGLLVLVGFENADEPSDIDWISRKIVQLRIFNDDEGKMNRSLLDIEGDILSISQFTLHASTKKGNRPSYIHAAEPGLAKDLYQQFNQSLESALGRPVQTGIFGADMKVALLNDGPVTINMDSKARE